MTATFFIYITGLLIIGLGLLFSLRWLLRKTERKRHSAIREADYPAAVPTSSPHERPHKKAQEVRRKSVTFRFTIIRHLLTLTIALIVVFAASFPFLDRIPAALFSLLIASSGVIVGIAARPFIENVIAGIVITFSRHLRIGDTVQIDEHYGTIEDITPIYTIVKSWDWRRYVIPNAHMLSKEFTSLTLGDSYRWAYVEFWVAPDADLAEVKARAIRLASECENFAPHEDPSFWVMGLEKEGIRCWLAAWADSPGDAWLLTSEMRTRLAEQLKILKISPHRFQVALTPGKLETPAS